MSFADVEIKSRSKYLKLESGESQDIRILDESPVETMKHSKEKIVVVCKGQDQCEFCQDGDEPMQRFAVNVYSHALKRALIWEYGTGIAKMLKAIAHTLEEEERKITEVDLKLEASGSGLSRRYTLTPRLTAKPIPPNIVKQKIEGETPF